LDLLLAWAEGAARNVLTPAVLLDNRMRNAAPDRSLLSSEAHPVEKLVFLLTNAAPTWSIIFVVAGGLAVLTTGAQLAGAVHLARTNPVLLILLISYVGYMLGLLGPVSNPKYRLPIEPVLLGLTALGIERLGVWVARRRRA
jgi:hypothetical protein